MTCRWVGFRRKSDPKEREKARANYIVKGGMLERTSKDGKKTVYERKDGTSVWLEADSDVVKNIG